MKLLSCSPTPGSRSLQVFGLYLCGTGALLLLAPAVLLAPLDLPVPQDVWIHILGVVALALGFSDLMAAREGGVSLLRASVWRRALAGVALLALVLAAMAPAAVLLFALVDMAAAVWTALAMRCTPLTTLQTA
ncbi:MAG: hypothetical protein Q7U99_04425 [Rubrivivax sp.]|nr:hypothetical protein [Rubrivivax sp.]MDP3223773.1 hypothetical protein [Rubrivivax sp.]